MKTSPPPPPKKPQMRLYSPLTSQVHRVRRIQRQLLWDKFRLNTLGPFQEQSVPIGRPAACEWPKVFLTIFSLMLDSSAFLPHKTAVNTIPAALQLTELFFVLQTLKHLRTAEFKPFVVFVKPPTIERLRLTRMNAKVISSKDDKGSVKTFTVSAEYMHRMEE